MGQPGSHIRQRASSRPRAGRRLALLVAVALMVVSTIVPATATDSDAGGKDDPVLDWVISAGGSGADTGHGAAADPEGNIYVTGSFEGSATFGEGENAVTLESADTDMFLASYSADAELRWVIGAVAEGDSSARGEGVAIDEDGNVVVAGWFGESATFGEGADAVTVASAGGADMFLASYEPDGRLRWVRRGGGSQLTRGQGVAMDGAGNAVVTGRFHGAATFGEGAEAVTVESAGSGDVFLASYDRDGELRWAVRSGGEHIADSWSVGANADGHIVVQGTFTETITFGDGADAVTLSRGERATTLATTFVASYDSADGTLNWAGRIFPNDSRSYASSGFDEVAVDPAGNSYVTGQIQRTVTFGEGAEAVTVHSAGWQDAYVASYDPEGVLRWVDTAGGTRDSDVMGSAFAFGAGVDGAGNVVVTGFFTGSATFGSGERAVTIGSEDPADEESWTGLFVASYDTDGLLRWANRPIRGDAYGEGWGAAMDGDGNAIVTGWFGGEGEWEFTDGGQVVTFETTPRNVFVARYLSGTEPPPPPPVDPEVGVTPESGPIGTTFAVAGEGFTPDSTATVLLLRTDDEVALPSSMVTTDAAGELEHEIVTDDSWEPASYLLSVVDDATDTFSNSVWFDVAEPLDSDTPPPPDSTPDNAPPGERDLTFDELVYRHDLSQAADVTVYDRRQRLGTFIQRRFVDEHSILRTGMHETLGHTFGGATVPGDNTVCLDLVLQGRDAEALAVCGAGTLVAGAVGEDLIRAVGSAPLKSAAMAYGGPLGDFSAAGRTTLSAVTVLGEVSLAEDPGQEIGPALLKLLGAELTGHQLGKLMDDYLASELASLSWNRIDQLLDREDLVMGSVSGTPVVLGQPITVRASYLYNPWTRQVVVYTSYDEDPQQRLFVITYEADRDARAVDTPTCRTYTADARSSSC